MASRDVEVSLMMAASQPSRSTAMKRRGGHRHRDCSVCGPSGSPPAPPHVEADERFWLESGDLVHTLPIQPDAQPDPAEPRPAFQTDKKRTPVD